MKVFELQSEIVIPGRPTDIFPFFSDAKNLDLLTPDWLHFRIDTPNPVSINLGTEIDYRLRVHGIPLRWRSRITAWDPPHLFVDEQLKGPYRCWTHAHRFTAVEDGTRVDDRVQYSVWGGQLANSLFIERDLLRIFRFRRSRLAERFGTRDAKLSD